ncbi:unnamed protein product [Aureobasidium vineae]|uniref:F-box domain-containing protein n=1 Tax=Aureobasidium vineae TaxID=2773715 RepID=A0A9N8JCA4_9PEZI|nr:unnamed protein product [Aureobasidium vineae]
METVASSSSADPPTKKPFPFFELPSELRIKIYQYVLFIEHGKGVVDLDYYNDRRIAPRLTCFRACRRMHDEAYPIFYGSPQQPFRLFPTGGHMYRTKKPLLELLTPTYRAAINTIELRLTDCVSLRNLKVFVQIDPTDPTFKGHHGKGNDQYTYMNLSASWLQDILNQVPSIRNVEIDAWEGVDIVSPMLNALASVVLTADKRLTWGPGRLMKLEKEKEHKLRWGVSCGMESMDELEDLMTAMVIGGQ